jgi:peptidyl-prolyl cis-trans isomerase D
MSVIQNIRDKYARVMVVLIAVSLVGFILMDALTGKSNLFQSNSTTVGSVNGNGIEYVSFQKKVQDQEAQYKAQGYDMGEAGRGNIINQVWEGEIGQALLAEQYKKLGITVSNKEMNDYLFGSNPPQDLKQNYTDSATGMYNGAGAQAAINNLKKTGTPEQKTQLANYFESLRTNRAMEKYTSLLSNTIYMPKWFIEQQTADNALVASASYVAVPYMSVSDSAVKVSDDEIAQYVKNHRNEFENKEEVRSISFVLFPTVPSVADSAAARDQLLQLKPAFETTSDYEKFLATNNSALPYYNGFVSKTAMHQPNKDSILAAGVGITYGPYLDVAQNGRSNFVLSRIIDTHPMPDTAKVRHILIGTVQRDPQSGQSYPKRADTAAKQLADSVFALIAAGQNFDSLVTKFSDDEGSKAKGGVYESVYSGQMVAPFNDFIFTHGIGERGIVKTEFGYHIVEILSTKGSGMGYKIAYLGRPVDISDVTENAASNAASQFASDSRSIESFNENIDKKLAPMGIRKQTAELKPLDFQIPGLGASRPLVKSAFDAKVGDVLPIEPLKTGGYPVAIVTGINKAGLQSVAQARGVVEPILRNKKKAEMIRTQIGAITTLEAVAQKTNTQVMNADSLHFNGNNAALGFEYKVIGAAFNNANKGKVISEPIEGQAGIYVVRVNNISALPLASASAAIQRPMLQQQARQQAQNNNPIEALKKTATIKDTRSKFF